MRKCLLCLLILLLPVMVCAESCSICDGASDLCFADEHGALYCSGTLVSYPEDATAESYTVREGTRIVGENAFQGNEWIEKVTLPEGLVMIDESAFDGCVALRHVEMPDSLLIIAGSAFCYCPSLEEIVLPPNLYAIGSYAFVDCWKMTKIDIPETVRYIGEEAFCNTGLKEVWLRTIEMDAGNTIFRPNELYYKASPLTIHVSEELLCDEVGNLWHFIDAYSEGYNVTFVYDVPYCD